MEFIEDLETERDDLEITLGHDVTDVVKIYNRGRMMLGCRSRDVVSVQVCHEEGRWEAKLFVTREGSGLVITVPCPDEATAGGVVDYVTGKMGYD